jgi:hypothetical protein
LPGGAGSAICNTKLRRIHEIQARPFVRAFSLPDLLVPDGADARPPPSGAALVKAKACP